MIHSGRPHILTNDSVTEASVHLRLKASEWWSILGAFLVLNHGQERRVCPLFSQKKKKIIHRDKYIFQESDLILVHATSYI